MLLRVLTRRACVRTHWNIANLKTSNDNTKLRQNRGLVHPHPQDRVRNMATQVDSAPLPTVTVYQYDETLRKYPTKITRIFKYSDLSAEERALFKTPSEQTYVLEFSHTIFYVQGGGQPFDTGYVSTTGDAGKEKHFAAEAVRYGPGGKILHFGRFEADMQPFLQGDMVIQHVDSARRDINSRIHTAGHIIGLAVRRLAEETPELEVMELKAQHYPDASFVEFKGIIDGKYKESIQSLSSKFVSDALPVKLYWYKPEELKEKGAITVGMPIVANPDGNVRVVDIVGAGAYPCGGTHVQDSRLVGTITVKNIKRQKGVSKISYAIGDN